MHDRFAATERIVLGLVASNLDQVHAEARTIAAMTEPDVLETWRPYFEDVRTSASQLAATESTSEAAIVTAELGKQCARCHRASAARLDLREPPRPDPGVRLAATMEGHRWAAARLWEGLIEPSDARWNAGAEMMARAPLTIVAEDPDRPLGIADDVARVRLLARRALEPHDLDGRTQLYGEILQTCIHCHTVIRDR